MQYYLIGALAVLYLVFYRKMIQTKIEEKYNFDVNVISDSFVGCRLGGLFVWFAQLGLAVNANDGFLFTVLMFIYTLLLFPSTLELVKSLLNDFLQAKYIKSEGAILYIFGFMWCTIYTICLVAIVYTIFIRQEFPTFA